MHYANGREAKVGDRVVYRLGYGDLPAAGVVVSVVPGSTSCNALVAPLDRCNSVTLSQALHIDDAFPKPEE